MNNSIKEVVSKVKLIDINLFRLGMMIVSVIIITSRAVLSINAEHEKEVEEITELMSEFDNMEFNDNVIEFFYLEYNTYFGGYYIEDGSKIICITFETPLEGLTYLNDANREYNFVNVNYMQLQGVYNIVIKHLYDEGYIGAGINHKRNIIELYVKPDTVISPELVNYVWGGLIEVIESNLSYVDTSE
jgi:hypothetical protein